MVNRNRKSLIKQEVKVIFTSALLVCLMLFSACSLSAGGTEDKQNLSPSNETEEETPAQGIETDSSPVPDTGNYEIEDPSYSYGNMQKNVPSGDFADYGDEILFFPDMERPERHRPTGKGVRIRTGGPGTGSVLRVFGQHSSKAFCQKVADDPAMPWIARLCDRINLCQL